MKILVVDDMEDNREIVEKLLKRFGAEKKEKCEIFSAANGQEAIDITSKERIDLIFMDINMPVMNGLEATKIIKKSCPDTMIIVVSSEHDEDVKVEILQAGAEDYINKPFSPAIMMSRFSNYFKLLNSRNKINFQSQAMNTLTNNIYSYQMSFFISNDDELAQFWETMLMRFDYHNYITNLSDFVRFLYQLATYQLQKSYKCHIYLEEDAENFYFTMDNMKLLPVEPMREMIHKYCAMAQYDIKDDYLTFVLPRIQEELETVQAKPSQEAGSLDKSPNELIIPTPEPVVAQTLQTYEEILDPEILAEFEHIVLKLKTEISMMGTSSLELDDIDTMHGYMTELAGMLSTTNDAYPISEALKNLAMLLEEYNREFLEKSKDVASMVQAFINDIMMWKEMIFYTGAPSVDFLNNSISSNVEMIRAVFIDTASEGDSLDDIFDF